MIPTVGDVMREVRNYFHYIRLDDTWTIRDGQLSPDELLMANDWIAITGSARSDGVYQLGEQGRLPACTNDHFKGTVWILTPPPAFLALCDDIAAWCRTQPQQDIRRESFGGYSREMAMDAQGVPTTWQKRFARDLAPYRRMFAGVKFRC